MALQKALIRADERTIDRWTPDRGPALRAAVEAYFARREIEDKQPTWSGIAEALSVTTQGLWTLLDRNEFRETLVAAKMKCENHLVDKLLSGDKNTSIPSMFLLKTQHRYRETGEENSGGAAGGKVNIILNTGLSFPSITGNVDENGNQSLEITVPNGANTKDGEP